MCKYCDDRKYNDLDFVGEFLTDEDFTRNVSEEVQTDKFKARYRSQDDYNLIVDVSGDELVSIVGEYDEEGGIKEILVDKKKIRFCPMCGRKLVKDDIK